MIKILNYEFIKSDKIDFRKHIGKKQILPNIYISDNNIFYYPEITRSDIITIVVLILERNLDFLSEHDFIDRHIKLSKEIINFLESN